MLGGATDFTADDSKVDNNNGFTIDKLSELKRLFEDIKGRENKVKLSELRKRIKDSSISEQEINDFFKDFILKGQKEITGEEFNQHASKVEQVLLEMCLGGEGTKMKEQNEFVANNSIESSDTSYTLPKEGEKIEGQYLSADDYTLEEYIGTTKYILSSAMLNDKYQQMTMTELAKLIQDINGYIAIIKKKAERLSEELKESKNALENKEYQEEFLKTKIRNYQDRIDELQAAKEKLESDVQQLFSMEADFKRLRDRNADLDMQLLSSSEEIQKLTAQNTKMTRELQQLKKKNESLEKEAMEGRLDKAELSVEIENLREELQKVKESVKEVEVVKVKEEKKEVPEEIVEQEKAVEPQVIVNEPIKETDQGLKKKMFELKTKVDGLQSKIDVV
jgi:hypothetical protein